MRFILSFMLRLRSRLLFRGEAEVEVLREVVVGVKDEVDMDVEVEADVEV